MRECCCKALHIVTELVGLVALDGTTEIVATNSRVAPSSVERGYGESAAVRLLFTQHPNSVVPEQDQLLLSHSRRPTFPTVDGLFSKLLVSPFILLFFPLIR